MEKSSNIASSLSKNKQPLDRVQWTYGKPPGQIYFAGGGGGSAGGGGGGGSAGGGGGAACGGGSGAVVVFSLQPISAKTVKPRAKRLIAFDFIQGFSLHAQP
jgi:hypothetical protein